MRIIERESIDVNKWNSLVSSTIDASCFSYSWYLDAVAENWAILINEDYTEGLALPFTKKLGVEILYTPPFVRYIEILGNNEVSSDIATIILSRFKNIDVKSKTQFLPISEQDKVYQFIESNREIEFKSQAKRMLKKAVKNNLEIHVSAEYESVLKVVESQLSGRIEGINNMSMSLLAKLFGNIKKHEYIVSFLLNNGGIVCVETENKLLYLKGTVSDEDKKLGGMYLALNAAINYAQNKGLKFDFGGSNAEGVKRFNHNLMGDDKAYFSNKRLKLPIWYTLAKKIRKRF